MKNFDNYCHVRYRCSPVVGDTDTAGAQASHEVKARPEVGDHTGSAQRVGRAPGETGPSASAPAQGTHLQVRLEAVPGGTVKGLRGAGWSLIGHSLVTRWSLVGCCFQVSYCSSYMCAHVCICPLACCCLFKWSHCCSK